MEATGIYWIPVCEVLERAGFEVRLVDPRATKRSDGRKTDVLDGQWIQQLMSLGLFSGTYPYAQCVLHSTFVCSATRAFNPATESSSAAHAEDSDANERSVRQCAQCHRR